MLIIYVDTQRASSLAKHKRWQELVLSSSGYADKLAVVVVSLPLVGAWPGRSGHSLMGPRLLVDIRAYLHENEYLSYVSN